MLSICSYLIVLEAKRPPMSAVALKRSSIWWEGYIKGPKSRSFRTLINEYGGSLSPVKKVTGCCCSESADIRWVCGGSWTLSYLWLSFDKHDSFVPSAGIRSVVWYAKSWWTPTERSRSPRGLCLWSWRPLRWPEWRPSAPCPWAIRRSPPKSPDPPVTGRRCERSPLSERQREKEWAKKVAVSNFPREISSIKSVREKTRAKLGVKMTTCSLRCGTSYREVGWPSAKI